MDKKLIGGIIFILAGVVMLLNQFGVLPGELFLLFVAFGFVAAYFFKGGKKEYKNMGLLIPGVIILALALYSSLPEWSQADEVSPVFFFLFLAVSFLAIFVIHTMWFRGLSAGERFWPLYPAGGLLLFSIFFLAVTSDQFHKFTGYLSYIGIAALLIVGGWLIVSSILKSKP